MAVSVSADLTVELERPSGDPVRMRLRGEANTFLLEVDDPGAFAGADDAPLLRSLAEGLAGRGMTVHVVHDGRRLVSFGAVTAPWWQRRLTGSRRIRIRSGRGAWTGARARARGTDGVLPSTSLAPAATLWPIAPTFQRRVRRVPTTTHDPARGGGARLVLVREAVFAGERQPMFWLEHGLTIGSGPECDVVLPDLAPLHARILHDDRDEWVISAVDGVTRVHGAQIGASPLRSGSRVEMGPHVLAYFREEYADHGRPHGGRIGGELGRQEPQAPRHEVLREHAERERQEREAPEA